MCSAPTKWELFDGADRDARRAHARRIAAVGALLDDLPDELIAAKIVARSQVSSRTARGWVREARDLREMPDLAEALGRGDLSGDQAAALRVLVAAAPGSAGAWVEALVGEFAGEFPITDLEFRARRQRASDLERADGGRYLHMKATRDERFVRGRFQLDPEEAALLERQLDARVPDDTRLRDLPCAHADALVALAAESEAAQVALAAESEAAQAELVPEPGDGRSATFSVCVSGSREVLDGIHETPGVLANGNFVPGPVVRELASGALSRRPSGLAAPRSFDATDLAGVRLDTKNVPEAVRRLVWQRDGGRCRFTGCTTPTLEPEIHHLRPRAAGGTHHPSNLVMLCALCHRIRIHRAGWRVAGDGNEQVSWSLPDGAPYNPQPVVRARAPTPV